MCALSTYCATNLTPRVLDFSLEYPHEKKGSFSERKLFIDTQAAAAVAAVVAAAVAAAVAAVVTAAVAAAVAVAVASLFVATTAVTLLFVTKKRR